jgi:hypothetical protein
MHVIKKEERDLMGLLKKMLKKKTKKKEEEWSATSAMEAEEELRAMSKKTLGM